MQHITRQNASKHGIFEYDFHVYQQLVRGYELGINNDKGIWILVPTGPFANV